MKYRMDKVMGVAWTIARRESMEFREALYRAWLCAKINAFRIEAAKEAAGVTEETDTWAGWKEKGFEVKHGEKALFGCDLIYESKGDGETYKARFFGRSQVQEIA